LRRGQSRDFPLGGHVIKLANLFTVNALIAALFGIAFLVAPVQVLATYGVTVTPGTAVVSRLFGAALFGYGVLTWRVRAAAPSDALRSIVLALCVGDGLGFIAEAPQLCVTRRCA
jgi:hypothetical protein